MVCKVLHLKREIFTTYSVLGNNWLCTTNPKLQSARAFFANDVNLPFFVINTDKCPLTPKRFTIIIIDTVCFDKTTLQ